MIDGATLDVQQVTLVRNQPGDLKATLLDARSNPIPGQNVEFSFDADHDGSPETYSATTISNGVATARITPTRAVGGGVTVGASWDGVRTTARDSAWADVTDTATITLDPTTATGGGTRVEFDVGTPTSGDLTDSVTVGATLTDHVAGPLALRTLTLQLGSQTQTATTDASGHAKATFAIQPPAGSQALSASFAADATYEATSDTLIFTVSKETTTLTMPDVMATDKHRSARAVATLDDSDDGGLTGKTVRFYANTHGRWKLASTATTDCRGVANWRIPAWLIATSTAKTPIRAIFSSDATYLSAQADAFAYRPPLPRLPPGSHRPLSNSRPRQRPCPAARLSPGPRSRIGPVSPGPRAARDGCRRTGRSGRSGA